METLVMPMNYVELQEDEMMYLDGGLSWWETGLIMGAAIAVGGVLTVAFATGQIWLAAKILGIGFKAYIQQAGVAQVASIVATSLGASFAMVYKALDIIRTW